MKLCCDSIPRKLSQTSKGVVTFAQKKQASILRESFKNGELSPETQTGLVRRNMPQKKYVFFHHPATEARDTSWSRKLQVG